MDTLHITTERVDEIPVLIGLARQMGLDRWIDQYLGSHALRTGLPYGTVAIIWLAFILSVGDHYKSHVQAWVARHRTLLERLVHQPIRETDFTDDRLGQLLARFGATRRWERLEAALGQYLLRVYAFSLEVLHLDSTTTCGYHTPHPGGIMQFGHSKDHRPDLAQEKLMAASLSGSGLLVGLDVVAGQRSDDPLYLRLIRRLWTWLGRHGLLFIGDCKLAAMETRAVIAAAGDYYLAPLTLAREATEDVTRWLAARAEQAAFQLAWSEEADPTKRRLLGRGYEVTRTLDAQVNGKLVTWHERLLILWTAELFAKQRAELEQRLRKAERDIRALTPPPGRGRKQYREEGALTEAITTLLARDRVTGLLRVSTALAPDATRWLVTAVDHEVAALLQHRETLGWRVLATNLPAPLVRWDAGVRQYRFEWCLERQFHVIKGKPLGIHPLAVRRDEQLLGLTRLLSLGARLLTLLESQVQRGVAADGAPLTGLYLGQPTRATEHPTATLLLERIADAEITLTTVRDATGACQQHLTPLPPVLVRVLHYLGLPESLYTDLPQSATVLVGVNSG